MPSELLDWLRTPGRLILCSTMGSDGLPYPTTLSWALPSGSGRVLLAVDQRSRTLANIASNPWIQLTLLGAGGCHFLTGAAAVVATPELASGFPIAVLSMDVKSHRNGMHAGFLLSAEPETQLLGEPTAALELDEQVFGALKRFA